LEKFDLFSFYQALSNDMEMKRKVFKMHKRIFHVHFNIQKHKELENTFNIAVYISQMESNNETEPIAEISQIGDNNPFFTLYDTCMFEKEELLSLMFFDLGIKA
jgi:hypothetical protein